MMTNCRYYDIGDIQKIESKPNSLSLSLSLSFALFHLNACSLNKNFDDPKYLIKTINQIFDVITISESRIKSNLDITTNINLPNFSMNTHQQSHAGGTILYISNNIAYQPRKELNIYKTHELESTVNPN